MGIYPVSLERAAGAGSTGTCCLSAKPAFTGGFFDDLLPIGTNFKLTAMIPS
jgi:hypothetical protein